MNPRSSPLPLLIAAALLLGGPLAAQEVALYRDALEAIDAEDWTGARELLVGAIAEEPEERRRAMRRPYIPHYYLGYVSFQLRDCRRAVGAFEESESQGVINRTRFYTDLKERLAICSARVDAQARLAAARAPAAELRRLAQNPILESYWRSGSPPAGQLRDRLIAELAQAARDMQADEAWTDPRRSGEIAEQAAQTGRQAADLLARARAQLASRQDLLESGRDALGEAVAAAEQTVQDSLDNRAEDVREARVALLDLVARANAASELSLDEVEGLTAEIREAIETLTGLAVRRPAVEVLPPVPAVLLDAARQFFAADYEAVLETLAEPALETPRAAAQAYLLRAAARFTLSALGAEAGDQLLAAARADLELGLESDPELAPSPEAFSPRFLAFFAGEDEPPGGSRPAGGLAALAPDEPPPFDDEPEPAPAAAGAAPPPGDGPR